MILKDIQNLNDRIYKLDEKISRDSKVVFISTLIFALTQNKDFQNVGKLTTLINFADENKKPIDQIIEIATDGIKNLGLLQKTEDSIFDSIRTISGVNTKLDNDRKAFQSFIQDFISKDFVSLKPSDPFLETLYMEIDHKAGKSDEGIVLTPMFAAELMVDLAQIDYKKDVVADLCAGTGLFSLLSYSKMMNDINNDLKLGTISKEEHKKYLNKIYNSIIANDSDSKMVTLCLANFLLKSLNHTLIFSENVLNIQKSDFKVKIDNEEKRIQPSKAILNPPYEDTYKPLEIVEKNIALVSENQVKGTKVIVIIPPQKFGKNNTVFSRILNMSTLETVIKMQDDLFSDSGKSQPASIFVFNVDKPHKKEDKITYYNFVDTGFVHLKDSGLVDKNGTFNKKKKALMDKILKIKPVVTLDSFVRKWDNFYEVNTQLEAEAFIDPSRIKTDKQEADITLENITTKKILEQKYALLKSVNNHLKDEDGILEKYVIDILSEE